MRASSPRRVHGTALKTQVIAACREPGASVSAVAEAHGLHASLVRNWLIGRGVKRAGLPSALQACSSGARRAPASAVANAPLQFMPIDLAAQAGTVCSPAAAGRSETWGPDASIHIDASRGELRLSLRWPASQAGACASLLRELLALAR